ncbi:MAG: hypothetical protein VX311_06205 [Planctomycetota bacterium]|nr:hypothetical protein [Planctomycetota bacterium]
MLIRPLHSDRRLLLVLLTVMTTPLFLTAQDQKPAAKTPARTDQPKSQDQAKPSANPATLFDQLDKNKDGVLAAEEIPAAQAKAFDRLIRIGDRNKDGRLTRQEFLSSLQPEQPVTPSRSRTRQGRSASRTSPAPSQSFVRLDKNKDGKLSVGEFPQGVRERIAGYLKQIGKDSLNREDYAKMYQSRPVRSQPKSSKSRSQPPRNDQPVNDQARRAQFFDRLDRDKDGMLTEKEFPENSRGLFTFLARRLKKKPGESISRKEYLESLPSQRPEQPEQRPRPEGAREARTAPGIFRALDLDGDSRISREELTKAVSKFEQLDTNRDGQLDLREFFGSRSGSRTGSRSGSRTGSRPGSQPGTATRPEQRPDTPPGTRPQRPARPQSAQKKSAPQQPGGRLFQRLDRNGNGQLESSEVPALLRERLTRLDTNKDTKISPEEFQRGLQAGNQRLRERPPESPRLRPGAGSKKRVGDEN